MFKTVLNDNRIVYFIKIEWKKRLKQMIVFLNTFP